MMKTMKTANSRPELKQCHCIDQSLVRTKKVVTSTDCEVNLGLESEHSEGQGDGGSNPHSDQHGV